MQLRKYKAPTMKEALDKVRNDLGEDAVIFSSRTLNSNNGPSRAYDFDKVEVTAVIERMQKISTDNVSNKIINKNSTGSKSVLTEKAGNGKNGFSKFLIDQYASNNNDNDIFS